MPTLNIEGRSVNVDDAFLKLSPDQQNATVDEIAKSFAPKTAQPSITDAVTDIPSEIGKAAGENWATIKKAVTDRASKGSMQGLMDTGKGLLAIPGLLASPITGAARSLIGHPMAQAEHAVGGLIAPEIAAKDNPQKMYETAKGDVDTAMSAMASRAPVAAAAKTIAPSVSELKAAASAGYEGPELTGLTVKPAAISDYASKTKVALDAAGMDDTLAPKVHAILSKAEAVPPDAVVTGNNIKTLRQTLGNAAGSADPQERLAASRALNALDEHIPAIEAKDVIAGDPKAAGQALAEANTNYSAAKHAETIDKKAVQAELRAAASNSGANVANTVRQRMADILIKPEQQKGFTADELGQMEQIVRGSRGGNMLRAAGNLMGGGGGLGAAVTGGIGAVATPGGVGGLIPLVGYGLKALSNHLTLNQATKLSEMIRSRAPLASSAQKFETAAAAFDASKDAKSIAGIMMASRNFSNNLRGAGINISPTDLMKGLQSPAPAQADQQQTPGPSGQ